MGIKKVAAYCRVSTDKKDQTNSFEAQQRYFKEYISCQRKWELYNIYADEGITGTSTSKRMQFIRMIDDARTGRFQLIITKEVSRFSRNILDTITYTRELKSIGVGVLFINDGIHTLEADSELRLSIMGSIAQEESRKTSERVKWGQTRQMEKGVVFGHSQLGYHVQNGKITVDEEGAAIVRSIFYRYGVEKKGTSTIARELREEGHRTHTGNPNWSNRQVLNILRNEKYVGDLLQKKTFTPDYLSHKKKVNRGEEPLIRIENHHEPIVDRDIWNLVQEELAKRTLRYSGDWGHSNRYLFSGKIRCAECGSAFVSRTRKLKNGTTKRWMCYKAAVNGRKRTDLHGNEIGCDIGRILRDDVAFDMMRQSLQNLQVDSKCLISHVASIAAEVILEGNKDFKTDLPRLEAELNRVQRKKERVLDAYFSEEITDEEMRRMLNRYDRELANFRNRLEELKETRNRDSLLEELEKELHFVIKGEKTSELLYRSLLDYITVYKDHTELKLKHLPLVFEFEN